MPYLPSTKDSLGGASEILACPCFEASIVNIEVMGTSDFPTEEINKFNRFKRKTQLHNRLTTFHWN